MEKNLEDLGKQLTPLLGDSQEAMITRLQVVEEAMESLDDIKGKYSQMDVGLEGMIPQIKTVLEGGIFLYPGTKENREGKLRLMYECNPFAFIFQVAGGLATNGFLDVLNIQPKKIHQRSPLFIGSKQMVSSLVRSVSKGHFTNSH